MLPRLAADLVLLLHLGFIVFAVFGALLALRWRWAILVHPPAAAWSILVEFADWACPLSALEEHFRIQAIVAGVASSRVERLVKPLIYPAGLTREMQLALGLVLLLFNLALYVWLLRRHRPRTGRERTP